MRRSVALVVSAFAGFGYGGSTRKAVQYTLWQADLSVQSLTVTEAKGNLTARVVIVVDGEALSARVEVLLPVGVGIVALGPGCVPGPNRTGISELRARVECNLGNMSPRSSRELFVVTTTPPHGVSRGFAVVAMSDTPDPKPGNNFVERAIPPDTRDDRIESLADRIR